MAKILIIDDDPDIVEAGRAVLEKQGHEVASAGNVGDAILRIGAFKPDLLILDVVMQGPDDGFTLARNLRRDGFQKPILMLTGVGNVAGMKFGRDDDRVPVDAFHNKPVNAAQLVATVNELLEKHPHSG